MSSASSSGRVPIEEDLHYKLQTMQDMFTSTRPVSILYLRGSEQDDPHLHPVALVGEPLDLTKVDSRGSAVWQQRSSDHSSTTGTSSLVSPSPSSISLRSQSLAGNLPVTTSGQWGEFNSIATADTQSSNPQQLASPPDQITKIPKADDADGLSGWIEALGVDSSYKPPLIEQPIKPTACFYILRRDQSRSEKSEYYRAVYLMQRTLKDFVNAVAAKWNLDATKIIRIIHVLDRGLQIEIDDDVIQALREGQDLIMEVAEAHGSSQLKREWEMSADVPVGGDNTNGTQQGAHEGYELRLMF